ncbi:radical SAM protein [Kribbella sandramycini]|uniref:MoaA/NifB/PqqE/SkfB family radical SAM enzyme n=1 Tax=Kribbella sandramycini TaxID=60450 RepID=A0A7Y4NYN1_9ACTN|nr:MoaA/NifB/PqqE/SkfB family radical SAM enzyme [Kribbella sandramycini]NOL40716.1 radical SAM protein [Kribbella sandramycini]
MKRRFGPDGVHLFDRSTGLNMLIDEVRIPRHQWSAAPRQVSIALTNTCDLACSYCYAPKHRAQLSTPQLCHWMDELDGAGCLGVGFGGGEPTLYGRLADVCAHAAERTQLAVTLTTHGHRWDAELIARLRGAVHFVRVSVDGVGATYERLRRRSFETLRERLELIGSSFAFGLNCVVNADTVDDLTAVAELAAWHGAAELLLLPESPTVRTTGITARVAAQMEEWVLAYPGPVRLAISEGWTAGLTVAIPLPREAGTRSYAHVDATGTVRPSSYSTAGQAIGADGILAALERLAAQESA